MRLLVFTAIFAALAADMAAAEMPSILMRCSGPDRCTVVNNGPCGSVLVVENGVMTPMMPGDPRLPASVRGVCGFVDSEYYTPPPPPAPAYCEGSSCNVTSDNYVNRP
ncbi:MAG: hypothetical protein EPN97_11280 [Alphaproteobacteria bacterium]|nr:MAG: hypothetical protein EPN97_11280 [Alphaproteobacteria bacterium]